VVPILSWANSNKFYFNWPSGFSEDTNNKELTDDDGHKLTTTSQMTCFVKWANTSLTTMIDNIIYYIPIRYQPLLCQTTHTVQQLQPLLYQITQKVQQSNHSSVKLRIKYNNPTIHLSNYAKSTTIEPPICQTTHEVPQFQSLFCQITDKVQQFQPLLCQTSQKVQQLNHFSVKPRKKYNNVTTDLSNYA
jgi:hypothetical protein